MSETVNQGSSQETNDQAERTFTQSQMDAIISDRLARERSKYADYETMKQKAEQFDRVQEEGKTELQKATEKAESLQKQVEAFTKAENLRKLRQKVSTDTGVPADLLSGETEEDCTAQAKKILEFAKPGSYPTVKDGGEPAKKPTGSTRDQFAAWFESATK